MATPHQAASPSPSPDEAPAAATAAATTQPDDASIDPLLEQMSSVLRLSRRPTLASQEASRPRRFSDPDQPAGSPSTVQSKDGSRLLPAPNERSHRYGSKSSAIADDDEPALTSSEPLAPHSCDAAVCAVAKVFATTELLELILACLSTRETLAMRRTSKEWDETIKASPNLKLHLFYHPEFARPASDFQLLSLSTPGLDIKRGEPIHMGQWIEVSMSKSAALRIDPPQYHRRLRSRSIFEGLRGGLGSSATRDDWPFRQGIRPAERKLQHKDLFLTQPPVLAMQAFVVSNACDRSSGWSTKTDDFFTTTPAPVAKMTCDAGITLGFLAETAQSLLADANAQDEDTRVLYKAILSFCASTDAAPRKRTQTRTVTRIG